MACHLNYDDLLARFDGLVAKGIVNHAPPRTVLLEDGGFALEFHISPSLTKKPGCESALQLLENTQADDIAKRPICFGLGSDIANSDPELLITTVRNTHLLVVNKFSVFRPQLLLLTMDSYRRQHEPLDFDDLAAACAVLGALESPHFAMFNCRPEAGASRKHKHMQIIPRSAQLFPDKQGFDTEAIPFRYFLRYLRNIDLDDPNSYPTLLEIYQELLVHAGRDLGVIPEDRDRDHIPHNVVLVKEWIIVIPRRSNDFQGVTANAAGMMGSVWLMNEEQLDLWKQVGPRRVLSGLGVPKEHAENSKEECI